MIRSAGCATANAATNASTMGAMTSVRANVLDWLKLLLAEDLPAEKRRRDSVNLRPCLHGALRKTGQDVHLFERLAYMARAKRERISRF